MSTLHTPTPTPAPAQGRDDRDTRLAWAALVAAPFLLALAVAIPLVASGTVYTTENHPDTPPPAWTMWLFIGLSLLLYVLPAATARVFQVRAHRAGDDRAQVPAVAALVLTLAVPGLFLQFLAVTVLSGGVTIGN